MVTTLFSLLVQQFNNAYVQPSDISTWFAAKPASKTLLTDLAKYFAQSKELDCEAAQLFQISAGSAEAKLKSGAYKELCYMEVEKENRKSRPLVSVLDLADYFYKKREVVVLGDAPSPESK